MVVRKWIVSSSSRRGIFLLPAFMRSPSCGGVAREAELIIGMMRAAKGTTLAEMAKATKWKPSPTALNSLPEGLPMIGPIRSRRSAASLASVPGSSLPTNFE